MLFTWFCVKWSTKTIQYINQWEFIWIMQLVYRKSLTHNIAMVYCMQNSNFFNETEWPRFVDWPNLFSCLKSHPDEKIKKKKKRTPEILLLFVLSYMPRRKTWKLLLTSSFFLKGIVKPEIFLLMTVAKEKKKSILFK